MRLSDHSNHSPKLGALVASLFFICVGGSDNCLNKYCSKIVMVSIIANVKVGVFRNFDLVEIYIRHISPM